MWVKVGCGSSDYLPVIQALREHCSLSGHDPSKVSKPSKQKQGLAPVQPAVPLELTVQPVPDQVEMERYCDFHNLCAVPLAVTTASRVKSGPVLAELCSLVLRFCTVEL